MNFVFKDILKGKNALIVGSGSSIHDKKESLLQFIEKHNTTVIGVNAMTSLCVPDFHLWTNRKQYSSLGSCISPNSKLIVGQGIPANIVRQHYVGNYSSIKYKNSDQISFDRVLLGPFRTAGLLAIALAYFMNAKEIFVAGMDGYTFHARHDIEQNHKNQHCYGVGKTDDASWEKCEAKDKEVESSLMLLSNYGIRFTIITPTRFSRYYNCLM